MFPTKQALPGLFAAALIVATPAPAPAASDTDIPGISAADAADIKRAEAYLNGITTMQARFVQMSSTGEVAEGDVMLWRPGRILIDYDPPVPVEIRANGLFLVYEDTELGQMSHVPIGSTPAGVLVDETIELNGDDLAVTAVERGAKTLNLTLVQRDDPYAARITLVFSDNPLQLRRWIVVDAQGVTTNFALLSPKTGVSLDPDLFKTDQKRFSRKD